MNTRDQSAIRAQILQDEADATDPEHRPHPDIRAAWIAGVDTALDAVFTLYPATPQVWDQSGVRDVRPKYADEDDQPPSEAS